MPPGPYDWAAYNDDEFGRRFPHVDPNLARRQQQREHIQAMLNSAIMNLRFRDMMDTMLESATHVERAVFRVLHAELANNDG